LIIPGTILWKWDKSSVKRPIASGEEVYFNSSFFIYPGADAKDKRSWMIEKAKASVIDGLPTGAHGGGFKEDPKKMSTDQKWSLKYQSAPKDRRHFFTCDSISCALEICYEHVMYRTKGLVKATLSDWVEKVGSVDVRKSIDLHLLTAGGCTMEKKSIAARKGGFILRTDGLIDKNDPFQTNLCKVARYTTGRDDTGDECNPYDIPGFAVLSPDPDQADSRCDKVAILSRDEEFLPKPAECTDASWFSQEIKLYERQPI